MAAQTQGATIVAAETNPRGIPRAAFIVDIDSVVRSEPGGVDVVLKKLNDFYSKYKSVESRSVQNRNILKTKIPEIQRNLEMVEYLKLKSSSDDSVSTHFELADNIWGNATIKKPQHVCLWLGANVMVEYSFDEAVQLLHTNLSNAKTNLKAFEEDIEFVKEQITTTEVNIARVFNYDVKQRRLARDAEAAAAANTTTVTK